MKRPSPRRLLKHFGRHKYIWTIVIFLLLIGVVDENSILHRYEMIRENRATRAEIESYERAFARDKKTLDHLRNDPDALLRVARETHRMKSDDEDVYYIATQADSTTQQ